MLTVKGLGSTGHFTAAAPLAPHFTTKLPAKKKFQKTPKKIFDSPRDLYNLFSSMNILRPSIYAIAMTSLALSGANAQTTATTDPVGFMTIDLPVGSDTIVAAPLTKAPVFQGAVTSRAGFTITSTGANFGNLTSLTHYVQAIGGTQNGMIFDVASNTADTITLVNNGVTPTGLDAGAQFKVVQYWTLGELFPASAQGSAFTASGTTTLNRRTQILFPNITGSGINRSAAATFIFVTNASAPTDPAVSYWRNVNTGSTNQNNTPILPDSYFTVRNTTNSAAGLKLTVAGSVSTNAIAVPLDSINGSANDNYVSLGRPVDITLNNLGLITSSAFTPSTGTTTLLRRDTLQVYNNAAPGFNKSAAATYYYVSNAGTNAWRSTTNANLDAGTNVIAAATGYVIRKASNNPTGTTFWTNNITIAQ